MRARTISAIALAGLLVVACDSGSGVQRNESNATTTSTSTSTSTTEPPDTTLTTDPSTRTLDWGPCDDPEAEDEVLECATLAVPLDHADPAGPSIDLALVRVPAPGDREGAVLFNPGGPGGSGFTPIANSGEFIAEALGLDAFDLVGFDPRGVDRSNGIRCLDDATQDRYLYLDDTPDTPEEEALLDEADAALVEGCLDNYGDTLRHYSTEATARDMDLIRAALGDEQISYLGISYGTYLGAVYATLFPDRVRAMALDSAYEPNGDTVEQQFETQLVGFEGAFDNWAAWCEADTTCAFHAADVGGRWDVLLQQLDDEPLTSADGREVNQSTMGTATIAALYAESEWPVLADALRAAESSEPAQLLALADDYRGRNPDGTYDTLFQSLRVISCASGIDRDRPPDPDALVERLLGLAPRFAKGLTVEDLTEGFDHCERMVGEVEPVEIDYTGDGPIVVVGGTNDPATPIRWAEEMTAALGPNARLVTYTGEGHGQLLASTCVTDIEANVLTRLELPANDTVCEPDPAVERPEWWDDIPVPSGVSEIVQLPALSGALGLSPTLAYSEYRTTPLSSSDAADAYTEALSGTDFTELGRLEIPIPDTVQAGWLAPNGDLFIVLTLGPGAFEDSDLAPAAASVPPGTTVVVLLHLPQ